MGENKLSPLSPERLREYDRQVAKSNLIGSLGHAALYGWVGAVIGGIAGSVIHIFYERIDYISGVLLGFIAVFVVTFLPEYEKRKAEAIQYRKDNYE